MAVDFPSSPTPGQVYTQAGATWTWDGVKWVAQGTGTGVYLPLTGGTMTGDITLKGDPSAPLHPVTYRMVSNPNDNRIINGDMRIDQRNNGAAGTAAGYTVDRWQISGSLTGKLNWGRNYGSIAAFAPGFPYCFGCSAQSTFTLAAGDFFRLGQPLEADMISDFAWGKAGAQPVTLSFWAYSSLTGTFSGSICNDTANRSYPFTYSIPAANTWTKITLTIPGDTVGTWVTSGNNAGAILYFDLGTGAAYRGPANAWASTNYVGATGSVSVVTTTGAYFYVTGVKLEIGSVATPFNRQSLAKSMADCQRYYQKGQIAFQGYSIPGILPYAGQAFPVQMRGGPTFVIVTNNSANVGAVNYAPLAPPGMGATLVGTNVAATGGYTLNVNYTADAEL